MQSQGRNQDGLEKITLNAHKYICMAICMHGYNQIQWLFRQFHNYFRN